MGSRGTNTYTASYETHLAVCNKIYLSLIQESHVLWTASKRFEIGKNFSSANSIKF